MKRKLLSLLTIQLLGLAAFAQTFHIDEDFNGSALPTGWTNTANTGSNVWVFGSDGSVDHAGNQTLDGTAFAYFDDSNNGVSSLNDNTTLESPSFNNAANIATFLEFDYNFRHFGANVPDSFYVEVYDGTNWTSVFSRTSDDCGNYLGASCATIPHARVNISAFANANCKVRFTYFDGNDWAWYVGIDNVKIFSPLANDIGVLRMEAPEDGCGLSATEAVTVKVFNYGGASQTNFPITYRINNGTPVTETVTQTLASNDSIVYTFTATANLATPAVYNFAIYTGLSTDGARGNDSIFTSVESFQSFSLSYNESFENGPGGWTSYGTNDSWNRGLPTAPSINTAPNGSFIFSTNTAGPYNNSEASYLESPCLDFTGGIADPIITFSLNYRTEPLFDRAWMEYSTNNGLTWTKLSAAGNARNWYNNAQNQVWTGLSQGWVGVENVLVGLNNQSQVKLRFAFFSDGSTTNDGIGIDNVSIRFPQAIDLGINELSYPVSAGTPECGFGIEPITIEVENKGANTLTSYDIFYRVDNGAVVSETINTPLPANTVRSHTFTQTYDFSVVKNYDIDVWVNVAGDGFAPNDSVMNNQISNSSIGSQSITFRQNFDNWTVGTVFSNTDDAIGGGWTRASTGAGTNPYLWRVGESGANRSGATGPDGDQNTGGNGGYFMYTEASGQGTGAIATLTSPCIDLALAQGAKMSFWWHRYGSRITSPIRVDVYDGTQWVLNVDNVTAQPQNNGADPWVYKEVDLNSYAGRKIKVRFSATSGGCCAGDMAIDNIQIWEPLPQDAQANFVDRPLSGCNLTTGNIRVELENFGTLPILANTLSVSFQNNGGAVTTETVPFTLPVGATATYTFTNQVNLSTSGSQRIKVWTDLLGDSNVSNDTTTYNVTNRSVKLPRFFYDFEAMSTTDPEAEPGVGDFLDGWTRTPNATGANYAWFVYDSTAKYFDGGPPPIVATGPNGDHTFANSRGNGGGKFMCTNTNDANPAVNWPAAILEFPCRPIDFSSSTNGKVLLSFWYHLYGPASADLFIDVHNGTQWVNGIGVVRGQGNAAQPTPQSEDTDLWLEHFVELDQFSAGPNANNLRIRFRGQYSKDPGSNQRTRGGDLCIDDVEILDRALVDGTVKKVLSPADGCALAANEELEVEVMNLGLSDIIQLNMGYQVDFLPFGGGPRVSGPVITDVAPGVLILPLARFTFSFRDRIDMTQSGTYIIKVWTDQAGDGNAFNDTLVEIVKNETRPFPSCEDFSDLRLGMQPKQFLNEKMPNDWVGTVEAYTWTANDGSLGGPASGNTGGVNDLFLWVNTAQGGPGQVATIETPCFDLTGTPTAILSFDYAIFGAGADSMIVIDARRGGGAWSEGVDTLFPPQPATNGWNPRRVVMTNFVGGFTQVRFRAFYAQPFPQIPGTYAIDNVCMIAPPPQQMELEQVLAPRQNLCFYSDAEPVRLRVQNIGSDRIDSFQVVVVLDTVPNLPLGSVNPPHQLHDTAWVKIKQNPFFNAGDKLDFTVPGITLDMSEYRNYWLSIYTLLPGDIDPLDNNELYRPYVHEEPDTLVLSDDFESVNLNPAYGPNFNNSFERTGSNNYRWRIRRGPNRLGFTGPDNDHTLGQFGNNNGRYFVTDSRNGEFGERSILSTECISFIGKNNPVMRFWYHMFGLDMGNLIVEVNDDSGWEEVFKVQGEQHNIHSAPWTETPIISLSKYAGKVVRVRFISERGGGDLSDMAIDNLLIYNLAARDIAVDRISRPNGWRNSCYTDTQSVHVQLRNFGTDSLDFTQESATIQVNIWKEGLPWDTLYKTLNTNIWLDERDFTFKPIPQDEVAYVSMDGTFNMDFLDEQFIFETTVTMASDTIFSNNTSSDTVVARRRGGRAVKLTTANEICGGSALNIRVQDYFGGLRWEIRETKWDGTISGWRQGFNFPFDSAEYVDFPKDTAVRKFEYRVKVCDIDTSLIDSINVYTPGGYPGLMTTRCEGETAGISLGIDQRTITVPHPDQVDYFNIYENKNSLIPIGRATFPNFLITQTSFVYDTTSTYWMEAVKNDSCASDNRTRTRVIFYPKPVIDFDKSKLRVVDPTTNTYELCKDQTLVLEGGQVDTSNYISRWTITYPDGSTQTRNTTSIFINGDSLVKGQQYRFDVTTYNPDNDADTSTNTCKRSSYIQLIVTDSCITSLGELSIINSLRVSPNPTSGLLNVTVDERMQSNTILTIRDMQGALVLEESDVFGLRNTAQFNIGELAKGVYFMKLQGDDGFVIRKIVLQ